ncbi:MAG: O-methyltransferase [Bacteroidales bacterium]
MSNLHNDIASRIDAYTEQHSKQQDSLLYKLYRETHLKVMRPRMLTGHLQGKLLEFISRMHKPANILEIGTFTGYGTICLSRGLRQNGTIHTFEKNPEVLEYARKYFALEGITDRVVIYNDDAINMLSSISDNFDLVFIDGDKTEYPDYITATKKLLKPNAVILIDNVLWDGKVLDPNSQDPETKAIQTANAMIRDDDDFDNFLLPVRDGLMIAQYMPSNKTS